MPPPTKLTPRQVARLRLQTLCIDHDHAARRLSTPREVVEHHLAMQSQDWNASRWAIGSRLPHASIGDVHTAYDRGEIVRSWPMRGTVHAVVAEDLQWMLELMGTRALAGVQRRWDVLGIDEAMLEAARDVAVELLKGGRTCTRAELGEAIAGAQIDLAGQRAYHTVWYLAQTGTLVLGPTRDGEQLLALLDEWVPKPHRYTRDESLAELGRRYVAARGPVSLDDLAHWTKLTMADCRTAFEANADDLVQLTCGDTPLVMLARDHEQLDPDAVIIDRAVHALAGFDEHLLGYRVRDAVLDPAHATLVDPGRNGVFRWTIVSGSRVVGTWKRTRRTRRIVVSVEPFTKIPKSQHARVRKALERYGSFIDTPVEVVM